MKCKKCGSAIIIDGTHLEQGRSAPSHVPPSGPPSSQPHHGSQPHHAAPSKEPSAPVVRDIAPRWRVELPTGQRLEMSLDEAATLRRQQRLPEGTLICAPGKSQWLPPSQFNELERRAGFPVAAARPPLPTFTDVTVAFGAAETEVLKFQSRSPGEQPSQAEPRRTNSAEFFNPGDVDQAMASFDHITGSAEPPSGPAARSTHSSFPPLPRLGSTLPPPINAPPAPLGGAPVSSAPARRPQTIPSFPPPPPAPSSYPPPPMGEFAMAASSHASWPAPVAPPPPALAPLSSAAFAAVAQDNPLWAAPAPVVSGGAPFAAPLGENVGFSAPFAAPPASAPRSVRPAAAQLADADWESAVPPLSAYERDELLAPRPQLGRWVALGFVLLVAAVAVAVQLYRPALITRARTHIVKVVGPWLNRPAPAAPLPKGPEFDTSAAGLVLSQAAQGAAQCKAADGPQGKGRARVLFEPSGKAVEVAVSEPFHQTAVGNCVIHTFLKASVPAFGGQPVIVNKTFEIP